MLSSTIPSCYSINSALTVNDRFSTNEFKLSLYILSNTIPDLIQYVHNLVAGDLTFFNSSA